VFGCQWGKYDAFKALKVNPEVHESKRRKGTSSSKCNCPLRIVAIEDPVTLKWKAFIKEEHHNHDPSSEPTSHPSHRRAGIANLSESSKQMVDILRLRNTPVSTVLAQLGDMAGVKVTSKGLCNMKQRARNTQLGGLTAVQWLYDTLQELRWFCRFELPQLVCCKRICWWGMFSSNANF